ncbi:MAG: archease [Candidatus Latescibacterota bacterium]
MGHRYLNDVAIADVAFEAWGASLPEVFTEAARATLGVMVEDLAQVHSEVRRRVELEAGSAELLLYDFLSELVYLKDAERLLVLPETLEIVTGTGRARLVATLAGEGIDRKRHVLVADVKAVTLHRLALRRRAPGWEAQVVLDV